MRKIITAILLIIFLVSGGVIAFHFYEEHAMEASSARARDFFEEIAPNQGHSMGIIDGSTENAGHAGMEAAADATGMDFAAIRSHFGNDDIVAHLLIEGTTIDYLVVQAEDNEFYLTHDIWRNHAASGWIFLDYEADIASPDHNWIIYGHNMQRDHMFHSIRRYTDYDFFRNHRIINLTTPFGVYLWEIFSFYSTPINFSYNTVNFTNPETLEYMLKHFKRMSRHNAGITVTSEDRILTLSTCTNRDINERYVLHARLVNR